MGYAKRFRCGSVPRDVIHKFAKQRAEMNVLKTGALQPQPNHTCKVSWAANLERGPIGSLVLRVSRSRSEHPNCGYRGERLAEPKP